MVVAKKDFTLNVERNAPGCPCVCCRWTNSTAPLGSNPSPRTQVPLQTAARKRQSDSAIFQCFEEKEKVEYLQHLLKQCPRHSPLINTVSFSVALPVVVQYLSKHAGVSVKEVLVQDGIVVGQRLRQP